ncbi:ribulokinase [Lucifera butyrica]|uniref:Ribulokinase n=1 Tax=Lucifera butyrica TaxID=1351585 RepID=A0A498R5W5_9FIRM|nr:ribulokinase [Lucifera butyrica]VBB06549.1 ribulokinase [Lucifera butyrica]
MGKNKYSIGVDYGTQSGRALLVDVATGREIATAVVPYKDGVIDEYLPGSRIKLGEDWALQNPDDYLDVLFTAVPQVLATANVDSDDVIGLGIDFTACTMLPVSKDGKALCQLPEYRDNPHAWVKLWKHHAAQEEANRLNEIAAARGEEFLARYGGKISSEWLIPKIWQILNEAPEIYAAADRFMEAADWVTMQMTDVDVRNSCTAGYKAIWHKRKGYPSPEFFKALDPRLENLVAEKLNSPILPIGDKAGELKAAMAAKMGLKPGTAISVANVDAHVSAPAVNVVEAGKMLMIMGTSICDILLGTAEKEVSGMCGVVEDGVVPGFYGYEAGQSAVGDIFEWFVENCVPADYTEEAGRRKISIHQLLEEKASGLKPGENGLIALDWWNGNRSVLVDVDLTGVLLGANLLTKPEEIYRALIEATAYGKNMIIETFREAGVAINQLYACGGLAEKNRMLMQIFADVTNMEIHVSASAQTPALGAAMFGAVAAGKAVGGYDSIFAAAAQMARIKEVYKPIAANVALYKKLYAEYKILHDYFGRGANDVMKRLKEIKRSVKGE